MRLVSIRHVQPGMKVGRTIFTEDGKVLLGVGMTLTDRLIQGLQRSGIDSLYIDDPRTADIVVEDVIRPETRQVAVETIEKTVKQITNSNKLARKISLKEMGLHFQQAFGSILDDLMQNRQIVMHLANISTHSPSLYHHSVNVAVLSTAVGMSLGYNRNQLMELGIGAMLHDIGKVELPAEMLKRPSAGIRKKWKLPNSTAFWDSIYCANSTIFHFSLRTSACSTTNVWTAADIHRA